MDCVEGMKTEIEQNSVDIIITSPPYNIGIKYNSHKDNMPFDKYLDWMEEFGKMCARVLKKNGRILILEPEKPSIVSLTDYILYKLDRGRFTRSKKNYINLFKDLFDIEKSVTIIPKFWKITQVRNVLFYLRKK